MKIFHNPRCTKSRETLKLLNDKGINPEIVLYLEKTPDASEIKQILSMLNLSAEDLLRKKEAIYRENFCSSKFTEDEWIRIMVENPKLIERPIVLNGDRAVIARPPEKVLELL